MSGERESHQPGREFDPLTLRDSCVVAPVADKAGFPLRPSREAIFERVFGAVEEVRVAESARCLSLRRRKALEKAGFFSNTHGDDYRPHLQIGDLSFESLKRSWYCPHTLSEVVVFPLSTEGYY